MPQRYWLTLTEASAAMGVSKDTLKRALRAGKLPNAQQRDDDNRTWEVPVGDLLAAGYRPKPADPDPVVVPMPRMSHESGDVDPQLRELRERIERLQHELTVARTLADERAARIGDLQMAVSLLSQRTTDERRAS